MEVAVHLQTKTFHIQSASSSEIPVSLDLFHDFFAELRAELSAPVPPDLLLKRTLLLLKLMYHE